MKTSQTVDNESTTRYFAELNQSILAALETYANVHRGSGHFSKVTTHLYEKARAVVLQFLGLQKSDWEIIFLTPRRAKLFLQDLEPANYQLISDKDFGLSLGVRAVAVRKKALTGKKIVEPGGGTTKLYSADWVMWGKSPEKFEAGTPAIINIIAFAKALLMIKHHGEKIFFTQSADLMTAEDILFGGELMEQKGSILLNNLRKTLIGKDIQVPTRKGSTSFINLDNSASTPTFSPILEAFKQTLFQPDNVKAEIIRQVKQIIADTVNAPLTDYEIIFTSNTTESVNIVAKIFAGVPGKETRSVVLGTIMEHSSNDLPWRNGHNDSLILLQVDKEGFIDIGELESFLKAYNIDKMHGQKRIRLITISAASNVLGACNDLQAIGEMAKRYDAQLMVDAAQLIAHRPVDMKTWNIDCLAFSAHKVYAPFGCGVLVVKKGLLNMKQEEMEQINTLGDENAGGIAALGKALLLLRNIGYDQIGAEEKQLTVKALQKLATIKNLKVFGIDDPDSPRFWDKIGVIVFDLKNKMAGRIADKLANNRGIGIRYGCHCAHLIIKHLLDFTPFQEKFQRFVLKLVPIINLQGMARVSFGIQNTETDIDPLIEELRSISGNGQHTAEVQFTKKETLSQIREFIDKRELLVFGQKV